MALAKGKRRAHNHFGVLSCGNMVRNNHSAETWLSSLSEDGEAHCKEIPVTQEIQPMGRVIGNQYLLSVPQSALEAASWSEIYGGHRP